MLIKQHKKGFLAKFFMGASLATVLLAALGWLGNDIWFASTQWLLVGAILACFSIYIKLDNQG